MKILVVDDEPRARERLIRMLTEISDTSIVGEAANASDALARIRDERPDLVLLDIRMPGLSGVELAGVEDDLPPIIFTTAYDQYAIQAFEVGAVDYLLKPVEPERLREAVERARSRQAGVDASSLRALLERVDGRLSAEVPAPLQARSGSTTRLLDPAQVTRIYASDKYAALVSEGREFLLDESLGDLEAVLARVGFFRVHRSELVNLAHVRALHTEDGVTAVELSDGQTAKVSRRNLRELKKRLSIR